MPTPTADAQIINLRETDSASHSADATMTLLIEDPDDRDLSDATLAITQRPYSLHPLSSVLQRPADQAWGEGDGEVDMSGADEGRITITLAPSDLLRWRRWKTLIRVHITLDGVTWEIGRLIVGYV